MSEVWSYSSTGVLQDVVYSGVTGQAYTSYETFYGANGKPTNATYSNGMSEVWSYSSTGVLQNIVYSGVTGQAYTSYETFYGANGKPTNATYDNGGTETWSYSSDGAYVATLIGGKGQLFKTKASLYDTRGHLIGSATDWNTGAGTLQLMTSGLTTTSGSGLLTLKAGTHTFSLNAHSSETIKVNPSGGDTIDYQSGFGTSTIEGFLGSGTSHDTIHFASSMFTGQVAGTSVADWSAMLLNGSAIQSGANVTITDLHKDTVTLASTQLSAITAGAASSLVFA